MSPVFQACHDFVTTQYLVNKLLVWFNQPENKNKQKRHLLKVPQLLGGCLVVCEAKEGVPALKASVVRDAGSLKGVTASWREGAPCIM